VIASLSRLGAVWMSVPLLAWSLCSAAALAQRAAVPVIAVSQQPGPIYPGDVVLLTVSAHQPVTEVRGTAFGRPLIFWPGAAGEWHTLVAVGLETKAGSHTVTLEGVRPAAAPAARTVQLKVQPKQFETRRLSVSAQFVDPPASEAARIERDQRLMASLFAQPSPARLWRGAFVAPVPGQASSSFGRLSVFNGQPRGRHQGADFSAATGTPVRAPNNGRVVLAEDLYFSGNTVILDHGTGVFSLLAHLSRISVAPGSIAAKGDVLGESGATGRVTGPHLHWAVRLGAVSVDPMSLISASAQVAETAERRAAQ
jgi:murein DD-endopeptidase MepM/ murein hydrolase activator NlpD